MTVDRWLVVSVESSNPRRGWSDCVEWCLDQFENRHWRYVGEGVFEFKQYDHYLMFMLRWA